MLVNNLAPLTVFTCLASAYLVSCQFADYIGDDLDEYEIYENGYDAIEHNAIGSTYFDPYTGDYDETYGDSFVGKTPDVKDCQLQLDGSPSFNGEHHACQTLPATFTARRLLRVLKCILQGPGRVIYRYRGWTKQLPSYQEEWMVLTSLQVVQTVDPYIGALQQIKQVTSKLAYCLIMASALLSGIQLSSRRNQSHFHSCKQRQLLLLCISTAGVTCMIISICTSGNNTTYTEAAKHVFQQ